MKVRRIIVLNRNIKYKIDGIFYKNEMYIPEIIRDKVVDKYNLLDKVMVISTKK